jgi:DNA (cytosine-5)-methyltransferase 1
MRQGCGKLGQRGRFGSSDGSLPDRKKEAGVADLEAVEICAGAGGQALGLERAGFEHALAVELDAAACATLRANRPGWKVAEGDVADPALWRPSDYRGVALLAGGVPCPPFTVAGRQLGATDERDLFAWAVELCRIVQPRALLLENVRGLSTRRFSAYRQHVLDRLAELGYVPGWRLLHAADYGVPQLRPRTVLVALRPQDAPWFRWPSPSPRPPATVGQTVGDLMAARGWPGAAAWACRADRIAPTIVGGSKKHGGADLGPTRAKQAWADLGVDGLGLADQAPAASADPALRPRLTCEMVTRLQGWRDEWGWRFSGLKTARYRQIGNAFPPPVAEAVGRAIRRALEHALPIPGAPETGPEIGPERGLEMGQGIGRAPAGPREPPGMDRAGSAARGHDPVFGVLRGRDDFLTTRQIAGLAGLSPAAVLEHLRHLGQDFELEMAEGGDGPAYRLGSFRAFLGQRDHARHQRFAASRATIS